MTKILIVDDDDGLRKQLKWILADRYEVLQAKDREGALAVVHSERPPAILLDLGLPPHPDDPTEGMATLSEILAKDGAAKVIIVSGQSERENALRAIGHGAYDFLTKPIDEQLLGFVLQRALYVSELEREYRTLRTNRDSGFEGMLGSGEPMESVFSSIRRLATTDASVLIQGESGTGKELAARAIHRLSSRKDAPFVAINCGAIPELLLEGELFGHEKGSFTGAHAQRKGRLEMAAGGTLFLDEIGELTMPMQVKLLRFLQDHVVERIGGRKEIEVDTRVLAATNQDLKEAQTQGDFREDLYYRLAVVTLSIPPLRNRPHDIPMLATAFLHRAAAEDQRTTTGFSAEGVRALAAYDWPGNVRELENRVKRAVIMADQKRVTPADLELPGGESQTALPQLKEAREHLERDLVNRALTLNGGNISTAAKVLGISRPTFYELMNKLGVTKP